MWIRFTHRFDWKPNSGTTIVYKPGSYNVTRECADAALTAGKAVRQTKSSKDEDPSDAE